MQAASGEQTHLSEKRPGRRESSMPTAATWSACAAGQTASGPSNHRA